LETRVKILSYTDSTTGTTTRKPVIRLLDYTWGGSYRMNKYNNKYWMTYFGGSSKGYEKGLLSVDCFHTEKSNPGHEWNAWINLF